MTKPTRMCESDQEEITVRPASKLSDAATDPSAGQRWDPLPPGFMEAEEKRWAELLERLGSWDSAPT